ncbi:MAG: hypothetical protein ACI32B_04605 [Erysipelotrichaceae bacterium]
MLFEDNLIFLILKTIITYIATMFMMFSTTKLKLSRKKSVSIAIISVCTAFLAIINYFLLIIFGWEKFLRVFIFTISLPTILLMYAVSNEPFACLVFSHASHILASLYIAVTVTLINTKLHGTQLSDILFRILFYLPFILFDFFIMRHIWLDFVQIVKKGWGILALIPCAFTILFLITALYPEHYTKNPTNVLLLYLLMAVIAAVYISIGSYLFKQYTRLQNQQNRALLKLQVDNIKKQNAGIEALEKQTKIIRHDLRHMLKTIAALAENNDTKSILSFIENMDNLSDDIPYTAQCFGVTILDTTLMDYLSLAKEKDIKTETSFSLSNPISVDCAELAICLGNMLKTAIQLCEKNAKEKRKIILRCSNQSKLVIEVKCPMLDEIRFDKKGIPVSSDENMLNNIHSILSFCSRHDANCLFNTERGFFQISITV